MSGALELLAPRVRALLIDTREQERLDVRVVNTIPAPDEWPSHSALNGATLDGQIVLIAGQAEDPQGTLAHELVHALAGDSWLALPPAAREGLANAIAKRVLEHEPASARRLLPSLMLAIPEARLEIVWRAPKGERVLFEFEKQPHAAPNAALVLASEGSLLEAIARGELDAQSAYAIGSFVVERAITRKGVPELQRRCAEARQSSSERLDPEALLAMADLAPDVATWWPALADDLTPAALQELVRDNATVVAEAVAAASGGWAPAHSAVASGDVVIRETTRGAALELRMVPELMASLRAHDN